MAMKIRYSTCGLLFFILISFLISCEDDITFEFDGYDEQIVVDGYIEEGEFARVFLTRSRSFFDPIYGDSVLITLDGMAFYVPELLSELLIVDASVFVTDGVTTDSLKLDIDQFTYPYVVYKGSKITGQVGKTYDLLIMADGKTLTASTTILPSVPIDSLWFEPLNENHDSMGYIHGIFDDPQESGNYYRIYSKSKGRDSVYVHPWNSVWHDRNINGKEDVEFAIYHGANDFEDKESISRWYFHIGEAVTVKLCAIDKASYDFWLSFQQNAGGSGNPFVAPAPTLSNIDGGLGIWSGYGIFKIDFKVHVNDTILDTWHL